ncbi:MAG: hypothetical protein IJF54_03140 [Clostridia bacterium]|nr:hypothetical protein [Clostridia bacterium]
MAQRIEVDKMSKVFTLTLNPCFDVTLFVDEVKNNAVSRVKNEVKQAAGKGINVGKVLCELGIFPYYCMLLGANSIDEYLQNVDIDKQQIIYAKTKGNVRENLTVRAKDETYKINRMSSPCDYSAVQELVNRIVDCGQKDDIVIIAGSLPLGLSNGDFVKMCKDLKQQGFKIAIDCDFLCREELVDIKPWMFKVNDDEFHKLCGSDDFKAHAQSLCSNGIEYVVITMGEKGILGVNKEQTVSVPSVKVDIKSTVGAGDSAFAGLIAGVETGKSFQDTLKLASACGGSAVSKDATGLADIVSVEKLLKTLN